MNVVFDTNILISATLWDGSVSQKLFLKLIETKTDIFSSAEILLEYKQVLKRDFDIYTDKEIENVTEKVVFSLKLIEPNKKENAVKEDPDDNKIIDCAVASNSNYIVTYDNHLLKLKDYKQIKITKPEELLKLL